MAFFIVIRERRSIRVAEYKLETRSKAEILTNHLVKSQSLNPINLVIIAADNVDDALRHGAEHFRPR